MAKKGKNWVASGEREEKSVGFCLENTVTSYKSAGSDLVLDGPGLSETNATGVQTPAKTPWFCSVLQVNGVQTPTKPPWFDSLLRVNGGSDSRKVPLVRFRFAEKATVHTALRIDRFCRWMACGTQTASFGWIQTVQGSALEMMPFLVSLPCFRGQFSETADGLLAPGPSRPADGARRWTLVPGRSQTDRPEHGFVPITRRRGVA